MAQQESGFVIIAGGLFFDEVSATWYISVTVSEEVLSTVVFAAGLFLRGFSALSVSLTILSVCSDVAGSDWLWVICGEPGTNSIYRGCSGNRTSVSLATRGERGTSC